MTSTAPARTARRTRIRWGRVVVALGVVAALVAVLADRRPGAPSHDAPWSPVRLPALVGEPPRTLGEADGAVPDGTSAFDDDVPGVVNLDAALLRALRQATMDAADDGVAILVDSGWRSRAYQEHLLEEAVAKYGSREEAARWVAAPDTSEHVSGDAVDVGHSDAAAWLSEHGAAYGLCRTYDNEPWHYELRPEAAGQGCPARYADAAHDPRMQR